MGTPRLLTARSTASRAPDTPSSAARRACSLIRSSRSGSSRHSRSLIRTLTRAARSLARLVCSSARRCARLACSSALRAISPAKSAPRDQPASLNTAAISWLNSCPSLPRSRPSLDISRPKSLQEPLALLELRGAPAPFKLRSPPTFKSR